MYKIVLQRMMFKNVKHKDKKFWQAASMDLLKVLNNYDL